MSLRNFRDVLGGDLAGKAFTALFLMGLIRWLPTDEFALLMTLQAVIILSITLPASIINRHYVLTKGTQRHPRSYRALQVSTAGLISIVALAVTSSDAVWHMNAAVILCSIAGAWFEFGRSFAQKSEHFTLWSRAEVLRTMLLAANLIWLYVPLTTSTKLFAIILCQAIGYLCASRVTGSVMGPPPTLRYALEPIKQRRTGFIALYLILVAIMGQLPILLSSELASSFETASLSAAYRYYGILLSILSSAYVVIISKISQSDDDVSHDIFKLQLVGGALITAGCAAGYLIIPWVDDGRYPDAPLLFLILSMTLPPALAAAPLVAKQMKDGDGMQLVIAQVVSAVGFFAPLIIIQSNPVHAIAFGVAIASLLQFAFLRIRDRLADR